MKRSFISALLIFAVVSIFWVGSVSAQTFRGGDNPSVGAGETVDGNLYINGSNVEVRGTVNGDVFCAGQNVTVNAQVSGDVLCAGQTVRIGGTVEGDVRAAAQTIELEAQIDGGATLAAQSATLSQQGRARDMTAFGETVTVRGALERDAVVNAGSLVVGSQIGRNVNANVESLRLERSAIVDGNLRYSSEREANVSEGARVAGETQFTRVEERDRRESGGFGILAGVWLILSLLLLGLLLAALAPKVFHREAKKAFANPGKTILFGLGVAVLLPAATLVAFVSFFGIGVGIFLLLVWLLIAYLSGPFFAYFIGERLLGALKWAKDNVLAAMAAGTLVLAILYLIPVLNVLVFIAAYVFGSGMVVNRIWDSLRPKPKAVPEVG